jgi:hypothetical protein
VVAEKDQQFLNGFCTLPETFGDGEINALSPIAIRNAYKFFKLVLHQHFPH